MGRNGQWALGLMIRSAKRKLGSLEHVSCIARLHPPKFNSNLYLWKIMLGRRFFLFGMVKISRKWTVKNFGKKHNKNSEKKYSPGMILTNSQGIQAFPLVLSKASANFWFSFCKDLNLNKNIQGIDWISAAWKNGRCCGSRSPFLFGGGEHQKNKPELNGESSSWKFKIQFWVKISITDHFMSKKDINYWRNFSRCSEIFIIQPVQRSSSCSTHLRYPPSTPSVVS